MSAPAATESAAQLITRFENTFNTYDVDALMADMAEDCVPCRWSMTWRLPDGGTGSGRGVDIFRVRDGKVAEKLTYVTL